MSPKPSVSKTYLPTPGSIRSLCRRIQQKWSPAERGYRHFQGSQARRLFLVLQPVPVAVKSGVGSGRLIAKKAG